ncbi:hypothetical protein HPB49_001390 [Dermacentor silvarum]|uniref:Uncharacterized protein n=1 Tax=Dermacentor silvarum TaxID=543639 RepID=A0ACB8CIY5_DERSI|nr:hypothetical protein HPB49_001390 [Dermacentor silvarum]
MMTLENLLPATCSAYQGTLAWRYTTTEALEPTTLYRVTTRPGVHLVPKRACSTTAANLPRIYAHNSSSHCYRCGSRQHRAASPRCPAKGQRWHHCGLIGHFSAVCNTKQRAAAVRELSDPT